MTKTVVESEISVDRDSLAMRGWHVLDARARIVHDYSSTLSISVSLEFKRQDWVDRYKGADWLSPVVLELSSETLGEPRYLSLGVYDPDQLRGGRVRLAESGSISYAEAPLRPGDISLRLMSFDAADVPNRIYPLARAGRNVPVTISEEMSEPSASSTKVDARAYVTAIADEDGEQELVVVLDCETTLASYEALVELTSKRSKYHESGEFEHIPVRADIEVVDDTDFVLGTYTVYGSIDNSGSSATDLPGRPARWFSQTEFSLRDFAGDPHAVIVRLVDE